MFSLILHGGAGNWDGDSTKKLVALNFAAKAALDDYLKNKDVLSAVLKAVAFMEDEPIFNAGYGSALNIDGDVECDASIMVMRNGISSAGAVCALKDVKNPILVAQKVMTDTSHVILSGDGALKFAKSLGFECTNLRTATRENEWQNLIAQLKLGISKGYFNKYPSLLIPEENKFGTVGCVATDGDILVAATSTGGVPLKLTGRIGDSAIIGAGTMAGNHCAVSCTGKGELALMTMLGQRVDTYCENYALKQAVASSLNYLSHLYGTDNMALIAIDLEGTIAFNTNKNSFGVAIIENGSIRIEKMDS